MRSIRYALAALVLAGCSPDPGGQGPTDGFLDSDTPDGTDGGCTSIAPYCSPDRTQVLQCSPATGDVTVLETCVSPEICIDGACVDAECIPHRSECVNETTVRVCLSDGSGWEERPCPEGQLCNPESGMCEPPCLLRVFIVLDQSGSMSDGTPSKWEQARQAMHTLMTGDSSEDVEFGFGAFPTDGNCATDSSLVIHPVPDADDTNVQSHFTGRSPSGNTPIVTAIEFFLSDTSANLNDPNYHNFILLVSDGMDTCYTDVSSCILGCGFDFACILACEEAAAALTEPALRNATSHLLDDLDIRTFVVGFGADVSDAELSAIAEEGGTILSDWLPASDVEELGEAFETIIAEMWECNPVIH